MTVTASTEGLFRLHYRPLCLYALHFLGDVDAAEDVVQEAFAAWWEKSSRDGGIGNAKAYLFRSVRNRCIDQLRRQRSESLSDAAFGLLDDDEAAARAETEARLWTAIDALPEGRRKILLMAKRDGMSYGEIASELGISENTVRNQLSRALDALRRGVRRVMLFLLSL